MKRDNVGGMPGEIETKVRQMERLELRLLAIEAEIEMFRAKAEAEIKQLRSDLHGSGDR